MVYTVPLGHLSSLFAIIKAGVKVIKRYSATRLQNTFSFQHFEVYATSKEVIQKSEILQSHAYQNETKELDYESVMMILKNPKNEALFRRVPLVAYHWWVPIFTNDESQLQEYC